MTYDFAETDLAHIRHIVDHLEHSTRGGCVPDVDKAFGVNYWRARVQEILVMPRVPFHIEKEARDLLDRLDRLKPSRHNAKVR
ncbi:hypothetical protein LMG28688_05856 [Paraburkholderia caffeinitolerans]|uniref:Uncharacterized protein n=1 Tax=Paraburkholderia caffeinitolerans TaxID=1723730 RepID=A0A6J5GP24_9BURK|nr:hypothetical protein [Paraburkholderia caffeinitolerans]CAB3803866.1 hypothetical protein LMG28688_05856 [Paraburkholderia caffeinitolerans]